MNLFFEIIKFVSYSLIIVFISKSILVPVLRKLAKSLNLKSKTIGSITGISTSMPELLSVSFSAVIGLIDTSIYNIISSNFINLTLYILAITFNKNTDKLKNKALKGDLVISILTIIIPFIILKVNIDLNLKIIPLFLLLFILFYTINKRSHSIYLRQYEEKENEKHKETKNIGKIKIIVKYTIYLILIASSLFIFGNLLSRVVEKLSLLFNIPQAILGVALGFVTSIPEIITFFESQKYNNKNDEQMEGVIETTNNLLTSNLLNLCIIQSVGILIINVIYWIWNITFILHSEKILTI